MPKKTKTSSKRKAAARSSLARGSAFLLRKDVEIANASFVGALTRAIEFHRTNPNDPHGIGNAIMASLIEVRDAFVAYVC